MRQLFYYKMRQKFFAKCVSFIFAEFDSLITRCDSYYKRQRFHYKMRQYIHCSQLKINDQEGSTKRKGNIMFFYTISALTQFANVSNLLFLTFYPDYILVLCFLLKSYENLVSI